MGRSMLLVNLVAGSLALAGCSARVAETPAPDGPVSMSTRYSRQTAVVAVLPTCPRANRADGAIPAAGAAIAAAVIPALVDFGVTAVTQYLARLESERTGSWIATGAGVLPEGVGCIVVARGRIGSAQDQNLAVQGSLAPADMRAVGLTSPPDFYMEARIEIAPRTVARGVAPVSEIVLRPQIVHFARTVAARGQDEPKAIGMVLVMRGTPLPDQATRATASTDANAVFALNLGTMRPGQEIRPAVFPVQPGDGSRHPFADLVQAAALPQGRGTLNFGAFVTETAESNRVLRLINEVLERNNKSIKDGLTTAIQDAVKEALNPAATATR